MIIGVPGIRHAMISTPDPEWGAPYGTGHQPTAELDRRPAPWHRDWRRCQVCSEVARRWYPWLFYEPPPTVLGSVPVITGREQGCLFLLAIPLLGIPGIAVLAVLGALWRVGFGAFIIVGLIAWIVTSIRGSLRKERALKEHAAEWQAWSNGTGPDYYARQRRQ